MLAPKIYTTHYSRFHFLSFSIPSFSANQKAKVEAGSVCPCDPCAWPSPELVAGWFFEVGATTGRKAG